MPTLGLAQNAVPAPLPGPAAPIEWTFDPWREGIARPLVTVAGAMAMGALAFASRLPLPACTALALGIAGLTAPGFLPARFRVDAAGVSRRLAFLPWSSMGWERVRSATLRRGGLLIEPRGLAGWLANVRAWALPLPGRADDGEARERLRAWLVSPRNLHAE
jgi:hypothetical protein